MASQHAKLAKNPHRGKRICPSTQAAGRSSDSHQLRQHSQQTAGEPMPSGMCLIFTIFYAYLRNHMTINNKEISKLRHLPTTFSANGAISCIPEGVVQPRRQPCARHGPLRTRALPCPGCGLRKNSAPTTRDARDSCTCGCFPRLAAPRRRSSTRSRRTCRGILHALLRHRFRVVYHPEADIAIRYHDLPDELGLEAIGSRFSDTAAKRALAVFKVFKTRMPWTAGGWATRGWTLASCAQMQPAAWWIPHGACGSNLRLRHHGHGTPHRLTERPQPSPCC